MKYNCENCNYNTDIKSSYQAHLKTKKHIKNVEEQKPVSFTCDLCSNSFLTTRGLAKHKTSCIKKQKVEKEETKEDSDMEQNEEQTNTYNITIEDHGSDSETDDPKPKSLKTIMDNLNNQIAKINEMILKTGGTPIPVFPYVTQNNIYIQEEEVQEEDLVESLTRLYKEGTLHEHIGEMVLKNNRKKSDATIKAVIEKMLMIARGEMEKFMNEKPIYLSEHELKRYNEKVETCKKIIGDMNTFSLRVSILDHVLKDIVHEDLKHILEKYK
jgi:hypothetical protein